MPPTTAPKLAAPYAVTRDADEARELSPTSWLVQQGAAVAGFFGVNGPPEIVEYNFNKMRGASIVH